MATAHFAIQVSDRLAAAAQIIAKNVAKDKHFLVYCPDHSRSTLLQMKLWEVSSQWLPLVEQGSTSINGLEQRSPVLLCNQLDTIEPRQWLLNLDDEIPPVVERFPQIIEIVSTQEHDKEMARNRWKAYKTLGFRIKSVEYF